MLEPFVEDLGKVDTKYHELYTKGEKGFELNVDLTGLKSALAKERQNAREAQKKLKEYEGVDISRYQELTAVEDESLLKNDSYLRARKRWEQEREALKNESVEKDQKLKNLIVDNVVRKAALESGVDPESVDDVIQLTYNHFKVENDGTVSVVDKGGQKISDNPKDFFSTTYKEQKPRFYKASSGSGGGAFPNLTPVVQSSDAEVYKQALASGNIQQAIAIKNKQFRK